MYYCTPITKHQKKTNHQLLCPSLSPKSKFQPEEKIRTLQIHNSKDIFSRLHFIFSLFPSQTQKPLPFSSPFPPPFIEKTMKKLYRRGTVHPSPPLISDHLSFLPATILTLTVALSPQDREVLAYLISCSASTNSNSSSSYTFGDRRKSTTNTAPSTSSTADHPTCFNCYCFRCYMSYWVRWDSSPNRQVIHEIIDAYEDGLSVKNKKEKSRKDRRKNKGSVRSGDGMMNNSELASPSSNKEFAEAENSSMEEISTSRRSGEDDVGMEEEELDKGSTSVRRFVSFLGEKIWGVWT